MKRTPLRRKTPLKAKTGLKKQARLNPVSRKRQKQLDQYRRQINDEPEVQACALCHMMESIQNMQRHHKRGREGEQLLKEWVWVHPGCHEWIENNRSEAKEKGLLLDRTQRDDTD